MVLKELAIILLAVGCVFLLLPLCWLFPFHFEVDFALMLFMLAIVLTYAYFDVRKLLANNQRKEAGAFILALLVVITIAWFATFLILPKIFSPYAIS